MTKYNEALKEYNKGKDNWCMPRKGTPDYKIIKDIIEKYKVIKSSSKVPKIKETKIKVPKICPEGTVLNPKTNRCNKIKETKIKVPKIKDTKIKVPKICPEGTVLNPKTNRCNKIKETKIKVPKIKDTKIKVPKICPEGTVLNPKTNRCNKIKVPEIIEPIESKSSQKRSSVFIKQIDSKKNANIIANFLKNKLIKDKYTLDNRVSFYKYINNLLVDINGDECLERKVYNSRKGYTIKNKINLYKQIGTESVYGVIYLTSIVNSFGGFTIATKVMPNNKENVKEIKIMKYIADEVLLKNRSKHFVFMYKHAICNKKYFDNNHRIVCINELAHGDLKMLMTKKELLKDNELIMNLLFQVFISIGTLHNIVGYVHNDSHHGNFLYQKNNEEGYYEYTLDGVSYYLKSCGYNIMIYDFGLSTKINTNKDYKLGYKGFSKDYKRICSAFLSKINGWGQYVDLPNMENNVKIVRLRILLENIQSINYKDFFKKIIKKVFIPSSPKDMWITERPKNVINKIAFNIC